MEWDDETRIRRVLERSVRTIDVDGDLGDLDRRRARSDRRRARALAGATFAAILLVVAVAAVTIRGGGPETTQVAHRGATTTTEPVGPEPLEITRTFADGTTVRAISTTGGQRHLVEGFAPWWTAPMSCRTEGFVTASATGHDGTELGHVTVERRVVVASGELIATLAVAGRQGDVVRWIVIVQAPPGATKVTGTFPFPGGESDTAAVTDGVAVLSVTEPVDFAATRHDPLTPEASFEAFDPSGQVIGRADWQTSQGLSPLTDPNYTVVNMDPTRCVAPTTLPAPGAEQPADTAAARDGIARALTTLGALDVQFRSSRIGDGPDAARDTVDALVSPKPSFDVVDLAGGVSNSEAPEIVDLVFTDPTTAYFSYRSTDPAGRSAGRPVSFGEATLVDGTWKLTHESFETLAPSVAFRIAD